MSTHPEEFNDCEAYDRGFLLRQYSTYFKRKYFSKMDCFNDLLKFKTLFGLQCTKCHLEGKFYHLKTRDLIKCSHCGYQESVTANNSLFHKTRMDILKYFEVIYKFYLTNEGIGTIKAFDKKIKFRDPRKLSLFLNKVRKLMVTKIEDDYKPFAVLDTGLLYYNLIKKSKSEDHDSIYLLFFTEDESNVFHNYKCIPMLKAELFGNDKLYTQIKKLKKIKPDLLPTGEKIFNREDSHFCLSLWVREDIDFNSIITLMIRAINYSQAVIKNSYSNNHSGGLIYLLNEIFFRLNYRFRVIGFYQILKNSCIQAESIENK